MAGKRYTQKTLEADIKALNEDLARRGIDAAFEVSPRNGYCAVDWYHPSIRNNRNNPGWSGVEAMVEGGSPKDCWNKCHTRYYQWLNNHAEGRRLTR